MREGTRSFPSARLYRFRSAVAGVVAGVNGLSPSPPAVHGEWACNKVDDYSCVDLA